MVGENESGKSTLLEALGLALTGRINGRPAAEELNPFWFTRTVASEFFKQRAQGNPVALPEIAIEVFLADRDEFQRNLYGAHNSDTPTRDVQESACASSQIPSTPRRSKLISHPTHQSCRLSTTKWNGARSATWY